VPVTLDAADPGFETAFAALLAAKRVTDEDVDAAVAGKLEDVCARGDAALIDYTRRFDRVELDAAGLRLSDDEIDAAAAACPAETRAALQAAAERIAAYHERLLPRDFRYTDDAGVTLGRAGRRWARPGFTCRAGRRPIQARS